MTGMEAAEPIVTLSEAQAFARVATGEEEALVAGLIRTASGLCEAFLGQIVVERGFSEQLGSLIEWQRLVVAPVQSIDSVTLDGAAIAAGAFETDIDANGRGWVRLVRQQPGKVIVAGRAGMAPGRNEAPEAIRHGVLRLVAHLFEARDGADGEFPPAVTALWRPYRRIRLG